MVASASHDIFISYCSSDAEWVKAQLLPRLDSIPVSYMDHESLQAGIPITVAIENAVVRCRWTMMILSGGALSDNQTQYSRTLALVSGPFQGKWKALPVLRERCALPPGLAMLVCIDLSSDAVEAWERLSRALTSEPADAATMASDGLTALTRIMARPDMRDAVKDYRDAFQTACRRIERLLAYKDLHDQLHHLQLNCYMPLTDVDTSVVLTVKTVMSLERYDLTLTDIIAKTTSAAKLLTADGTASRTQDQQTKDLQKERRILAVAPWIQNLEAAHKLVRKAVDSINGDGSPPKADTVQRSIQPRNSAEADPPNGDGPPLKIAVRMLTEVLDNYPNNVNGRLVEAARHLDLANLIADLCQLRDRFNSMALTNERSQERRSLEVFEHGVAALAALNASLDFYVGQHDTCQYMNIAIISIDKNMEEDVGFGLTILGIKWADLKAGAEQLFLESREEWAQKFKADTEDLNAALETDDAILQRRLFTRFHWHADTRFLEVDTTLKELCGRLSQAGAALETAAQMLED